MFCYCFYRVKKNGVAIVPSSPSVSLFFFFFLTEQSFIHFGKRKWGFSLANLNSVFSLHEEYSEKKDRCIALWILLNNKGLCSPLQFCVVGVCIFENRPDWLCVALLGCQVAVGMRIKLQPRWKLSQSLPQVLCVLVALHLLTFLTKKKYFRLA